MEREAPHQLGGWFCAGCEEKFKAESEKGKSVYWVTWVCWVIWVNNPIRELNSMVEVGFAGLSWHCRFGNAVHLVNR